MMIRRCLLWLGLAVPTAQAAEYRAVHLTDGRTIKAEILGFTETAVTLGIPQGTMVFSPDLLDRMDPLSVAEYRAQPSWRIAILSFSASSPARQADARTAQMLAARALGAIPGVISGSPTDIPGDIRDAQRQALAGCRTDLLCAMREGEAAGIDVVMMGEIRESTGGAELRISALWVKHPEARRRLSITLKGSPVDHRSEIYDSQHKLLLLAAPTTSLAAAPLQETGHAAPVVRAPVKREPLSEATLRGMAWAPIPGLPHLVRGDHSAFAKSLAVAGVGAAVGIGMAGRATTTKGQFIATSLLSTYTFTALANQLFWPSETPSPTR
jgi:hypothetical protein